eukprot:4645542-Amphidinium_carterae.1
MVYHDLEQKLIQNKNGERKRSQNNDDEVSDDEKLPLTPDYQKTSKPSVKWNKAKDNNTRKHSDTTAWLQYTLNKTTKGEPHKFVVALNTVTE